MNKLMMAIAAAVALSGVVGAQRVVTQSDRTIDLIGCYQIGADLRCDFSQVKNVNGEQTSYPDAFEIILDDGKTYEASELRYSDGSPFRQYSSTRVVANTPFRFSAIWKGVRANHLAGIVHSAQTLANVTVRAASAPAPVTSAPSRTVQIPSTQAFIGGKAYTITFSNCKAGSTGYICNSTVTPSK